MSSRLKYGACPVRFDREQLLQNSKAFLISLESGVLHLNYPVHSASYVPERILTLAGTARNCLVEEMPNGSLTGTLNLMEGLSLRGSSSKQSPIVVSMLLLAPGAGAVPWEITVDSFVARSRTNALPVSDWFICGNALLQL